MSQGLFRRRGKNKNRKVYTIFCGKQNNYATVFACSKRKGKKKCDKVTITKSYRLKLFRKHLIKKKKKACDEVTIKEL